MNVLDLARQCDATVLLTSTSETYATHTYTPNLRPIGATSTR